MSYRKVYPGWLKGRVGRSLRGDADSYTLAYYLMTAEENVKGLGLFWQPLECVAVLYGLPMDRLSVAVETLRSLRFGAYDAESEWWFVVESARHEWGEQPNLAARAVQGMRPTLFEQLDSCRKSFVFKSWMLRYALPWADILDPLRTATGRLSIAYRETIDPPEPSPEPEPLPEPEPDPEKTSTVTVADDGAVVFAWIPVVKGKKAWPEGVRVNGKGHEAPIDSSMVEELSVAFGGAHVEPHILAAVRWSKRKLSNRKTPGGLRNFLGGWLERANGEGKLKAPEEKKGAYDGSPLPDPGDFFKVVEREKAEREAVTKAEQ